MCQSLKQYTLEYSFGKELLYLIKARILFCEIVFYCVMLENSSNTGTLGKLFFRWYRKLFFLTVYDAVQAPSGSSQYFILLSINK